MADSLPCPNCGAELSFITQYQRHYCARCGQYAPEGYGARGTQHCPACGGVLTYIAAYDRFYCYRCNTYPSIQVPAVKAEEPAPAAAEPTKVEAVSAAQPAQTAPVVAASAQPEPTPAVEPKPSEPNEELKPEPVAAPEVIPATPMASLAPAPSVAVVEAPAKAEESVKEEPLAPLPPMKPAALRMKIFTMKKSELADLCRRFELDPSGTKEDLQQRLLTYLKELEAKEAPEAEPVPVVVAPAETSPEPEEKAAQEPAPEPALVATPKPEPVGAARPSQASAATVTVQEPAPMKPAQPVALAAAAPVVVEVPRAQSEAVQAAPAVQPAPQVPVLTQFEHPCPTCGRELSYISQYGRWYCYSCRRYTPAAKARNACPACGATMRWIEPHRRWWCDECGRYAPADLPAPAAAAAAVAATPAVTAAPAARAIVLHRHGSPASGAGLVVFGLILYVAYAFFAYLGALLGLPPPAAMTPDMLNLLQFFAFLFVAFGAIAGLYALRDRA